MNDKQKILVMVGVGSFFIFIIGAFIMETTADNIFERYVIDKGYLPNWITLISAFFLIVSISGFFLFQDEPYFNWSIVKVRVYGYIMMLIGILFAFGGFYFGFNNPVTYPSFIFAFFILYKARQKLNTTDSITLKK